MKPVRPPIEEVAFAAQRDARRRALELRVAARTGGLTILLAGVVAAVGIFMRGAIDPAWALLLIGGAVVCWRTLNAPHPLRAPGLNRDFFVAGLAMALGALLETLLAFGVLPWLSLHLALAAGIATGAALLATLEERESQLETRVIAALAARFSSSRRPRALPRSEWLLRTATSAGFP